MENNQVPDPRFQELQESYRKAMEQVNQLKGMMDVIAQRNQPQAPQNPPQIKHNLKPEVADDVMKIAQHVAQSLVSQQSETYRQAYNNVWEKNDMNEFRLIHGTEAYDKYRDKIEALRGERQRAGQFMSRDEAYKFIFFDENGKKPKPNPPPPQSTVEPKFDPYLNQWVQPPGTQPPAPNQTPPTQTPPQQTPPNPLVNLDGVQPPVKVEVLPTLPAEGQMKSTVQTPPPKSGPISFNQDTGAFQEANEVQAFEDRFGDIPL